MSGGSGPLVWVGGNLVHSFCFPRTEEDEGPGMAVPPWPPAAGACHQRRATHSLCPAGQSLSQRKTITQDDPGFVSESDILPCGYLPYIFLFCFGHWFRFKYIYILYSLVAQGLKRLPGMREAWVRSLGQEDPLEEGMEIHSSILAWRILWMKEPGGLQSMGLQRVRYNWSDWSPMHSYCSWT